MQKWITHFKLSYHKYIECQLNLLPKFDGTIMFDLPPKSTIKQFVGQMLGGRQMHHGMDKKDDGHTWTITKTTNIKNDLDLVFRWSHCLGHLQCKHLDCPQFLHLGSLNKIEWDGFFISQLLLGVGPPSKSTLACSYCKRTLVCVNTCDAHIYYVLPRNKDTIRACIHIGTHAHLLGKRTCKETF